MITVVAAMAGKLYLSFLLLVVVVYPPSANAQSIENTAIEREEYAVYSATIADYAYEEKGTFIIANPTVTWSQETKLKDLRFFPSTPAPDLSQQTLDDFLLRNKGNRWLTPKLEMNRKYVLADFRDIEKLAGDFRAMVQDWKALFTKYPSSHGFVTLSRVGFNNQMDEALVRVGWNCPGLCGHWSFLMLKKENGVWHIVGEANRIVS